MRCQPQGSHFIDGAFVSGDGEKQANLYPATQETIAEIAWATDPEIELAINAAKRGFVVWRDTPLAERSRVLRKAADLIRARNEDLAKIETFDTGKAIQETICADALSGADCLDYFAAHAASLHGDSIAFSGNTGDWGYTRREPIGICLGIGAWNYPMQIACWKAAPALACGNAMIFKPAELTPLNALNLAAILKEAGLPDGVFNVLQGDGAVGAKLVAHPEISKISLTGESATGAKILRGTADKIGKVTLELGGKSPLIIFDDADLDSAVDGALMANFYSSGQVCSNATRVYIQESKRDEFLTKLLERASKIKLGDPQDPTTQMGPLVSAALYEKVCSYLEIGRNEAKVLLGGAPVTVPGFENGHWIPPTIFEAESDDARIAREEIFGPVLTIMTFAGEDEVCVRANQSLYGLAAGVYTKDLQRAHRLIAKLEAGTCYINAYNLTPIELPFGGYKRSGLGRENGRAALETYSQVKSVYVAMNPMEMPY